MEKHKLREQLQNSSISPSKNSWNKLNDKLDFYESQQKNKKWFFLKYAALFLVFISVSLYVFQPKNKKENSPIIVEPTLKKTPIIEKEPETLIAEKPAEVKIKKVFKKPTKKIKKEVLKKAIALKDKPVLENKTLLINSKNNNSTKVASTTETIDTEVEKLLKNATIKVNYKNLDENVLSANTLLVEVEDDLNKGFKEKLFETIAQKLKNTKEILITNRENY